MQNITEIQITFFETYFMSCKENLLIEYVKYNSLVKTGETNSPSTSNSQFFRFHIIRFFLYTVKMFRFGKDEDS